MPSKVVGDLVGDEALFQSLEVEVTAIAQQGGAVSLASDLDRVPAQEVQDLSKGFGAAAGHRRREDGRGPEQAFSIKTRKEVVRAREEGGKAEGEEVGRVSVLAEELTRDLELSVTDGCEDGLFVKLRDKLRH